MLMAGGEHMTREERTVYWSTIIERQTISGMSGVAWCRENHINPASFYAWRRKFNEPQAAEGFIELQPDAIGTSGAGIRIRLDAKLSIEVERGFDPFTLRAVVETLCNRVPCSV